MATSPTNKEEEEVRTEEIDPAKTFDEEDVARTEEEQVDPAKTTKDAEDEVRTEQEDEYKGEVKTEEEDEHKEEAIESLLDSAQQTENQNRQEDPITTRRSGKEIDLGSTSDQNPRLDSDPNASARNLGIGNEQSAQEIENQNLLEELIELRRSWMEQERGSARDEEPLLLVPPMMLPVGFIKRPSQKELAEDDFRPGFRAPKPKWLVVDNYYTDGFGQLCSYRTITPLQPSQIPFQLHELIVMELPKEIKVPCSLALVIYRHSFGHVAPAVMPPMMQQNQIVPQQYLLPGQAPAGPMMQQQYQFMTYLRPGQAPAVGPVMQQQDQFMTYLRPGQAPAVGPVMQQQDQFMTYLRPGQAPAVGPVMQPPMMIYSPVMRPMMSYNQQQQQQRQFNQGQQGFRFHQAPPNAAAAAPPPPRPQTQEPSQSQGSNDEGPSSSG